MPRRRAWATGLRTNATSFMPSKSQIGDELAAAAQQPVIFLAVQARTDALMFHRCIGRL